MDWLEALKGASSVHHSRASAWDIGIVLASPRVAEFLEGRLRQTPGVVAVHANPITGRLLARPDMHLTSQNVEQLIRKARSAVHPASSRAPIVIESHIRRDSRAETTT